MKDATATFGMPLEDTLENFNQRFASFHTASSYPGSVGNPRLVPSFGSVPTMPSLVTAPSDYIHRIQPTNIPLPQFNSTGGGINISDPHVRSMAQYALIKVQFIRTLRESFQRKTLSYKMEQSLQCSVCKVFVRFSYIVESWMALKFPRQCPAANWTSKNLLCAIDTSVLSCWYFFV